MKKPTPNNKDPIVHDSLTLRDLPERFGWPDGSAYDRQRAEMSQDDRAPYLLPRVQEFRPGGLILLKPPRLWITPMALEITTVLSSDLMAGDIVTQAMSYVAWRDSGKYRTTPGIDPKADGFVACLGEFGLLILLYLETDDAIVVLADEIKGTT